MLNHFLFIYLTQCDNKQLPPSTKVLKLLLELSFINYCTYITTITHH